jgi:very-short-patch-repair endonuclease
MTKSEKISETLKRRYANKEIKVWNKGLKGDKRMVPWNKGLTKNDTRVQNNIKNISQTLKEKYANGDIVVWCKGLTKENNESLKRISENRKGELNVAKRPEVKEKIRNTLLQTYEEYPEILENRKACGINQFSTGYTSIELIVKYFFDENNISYTHNEKIGRYHTDFKIGNLIVECDGDYWHNKMGAKEKDQRKTEYMEEKGFMVLRFTETELINAFNNCQQKILWALQNNLV